MKLLKNLTTAATVLLSLSFHLSARAEIVEKPLEYQAGDLLCEGWQAYDDSQEGRRPTVLIVHQWTGVSDNEKMRARMLAELGYHAFALDIYGKDLRPQPPESGEVAGKFKGDRALFRDRLHAGLETLKSLPQTDPNRIVVIGYCFGGTGALELARSGADLAGAVSFHGGLDSPTPEDAKQIRCPVLVLHGAVDPYVPPAEVDAFHEEMKLGEVEYEFIAYPDAVHSFTQKAAGDDPSKGAAYQAEADEQSWKALVTFLETVTVPEP